MRKKTLTNTINFFILGRSSEEIVLAEGATVQDLLDELEHTLGASEVIHVNGERIDSPDDVELENGDQVVISTKKDAGLR